MRIERMRVESKMRIERMRVERKMRIERMRVERMRIKRVTNCTPKRY
jgi:hypothetical protein